MQNLINHIIEQEKASWHMVEFSTEFFGQDSEAQLRWRSIWNTYNMLIKDFDLKAPRKRRNLSRFNHKKYTIIKTTEL